MTKYQNLVQVVTMALIIEEFRTKSDLAPKALARLLNQGPGSNLATIVNIYGIVADDNGARIDTRPVEDMAAEYIAFSYRGGAKPEWLMHAGL